MELDLWTQSLVTAMTALWTKVANFIPNLFGALVLVLLGFVVAKLLDTLLSKLLGKVGLDRLMMGTGLTKLLARCREEEPLTEVKIVEMTVSEMVKALMHDQIDAGFTVHTEVSAGLVKEVVWTDRPIIAIPRNHPLLSLEKIPLQEVARHTLILCHPELCSGGYDVIHRWFCEATLPLPSNAEYVSGHEPMVMLVAAGYGIGIGLASQITLYNHPDVIIRPVTDDVPSTATFITLLDQPRPEALSRFIDRAQQIGEVAIG